MAVKAAAGDDFHYGTGRRKTSRARVFLRPRQGAGEGNISVNGRTLDAYFGHPVAHILIRQPLQSAELEDRFDIQITVCGGGNSAQAQAIRHGLARALVSYDGELRPRMRAAGFLTRDSRKVERKKVGLHKARKAPQYSKR